MSRNYLKILILCCGLATYQVAISQSAKAKKAAGFLFEYQRDNNKKDLARAYELIEEVAKDENLKNDVWTKYYQALIYKKMYVNDDINKPDMIITTINNLNEVINSEQDFSDKKDAIYYLKLSVYDAYNEGLEEYNNAKYENSYLLYKSIIEAQETLTKNNTDLSLKGPDGEEVRLNNADIWNNYTVFCIQVNKEKEAFAGLEKLIAINPSATTYSQLIQMAGQIGEKELSEKYTLEALEKYPDDVNILISGVNYYLSKNNIQKSTEILEIAIKNNPDRADLYIVYGQNLDALERYEESEKAYLKGLEFDPENFQLNYNMGSVYFNKGLHIYKDENNPDATKYLPIFKKSKEYFEKSMKNATDKNKVEKVIKNVDDIIDGKM